MDDGVNARMIPRFLTRGDGRNYGVSMTTGQVLSAHGLIPGRCRFAHEWRIQATWRAPEYFATAAGHAAEQIHGIVGQITAHTRVAECWL